MTNSDPALFRLEVDERTGVILLRLIGELDVASAPTVRERLVEMIRAGNKLLVVDCEALSFIDSSGLALLTYAQLRMAEAGGQVRLAAVNRRVRRVLELSGLTDVLACYPDVEASLADA